VDGWVHLARRLFSVGETCPSPLRFLLPASPAVAPAPPRDRCLLAVTFMTEAKMLAGWDKSRAATYREYQKSTSMLVPMPPRRHAA
jgi:hypothetical protein